MMGVCDTKVKKKNQKPPKNKKVKHRLQSSQIVIKIGSRGSNARRPLGTRLWGSRQAQKQRGAFGGNIFSSLET